MGKAPLNRAQVKDPKKSPVPGTKVANMAPIRSGTTIMPPGTHSIARLMPTRAMVRLPVSPALARAFPRSNAQMRPKIIGERRSRLDCPGPWCTDQGCGRNDPYPVLGSCDADRLRASQLQHAVQDLDGDVHLSRPTLVRTRAQPVPDHALEPADGGLGPGARIVARGVLPAHPALLGDEVQVAVPLCRRGLGRGAGHGGRARRNDDVRARVALGHVSVNALLVVRAVRRDGGDRV